MTLVFVGSKFSFEKTVTCLEPYRNTGHATISQKRLLTKEKPYRSIFSGTKRPMSVYIIRKVSRDGTAFCRAQNYIGDFVDINFSEPA
jgi:hypothetical protein